MSFLDFLFPARRQQKAEIQLAIDEIKVTEAKVKHVEDDLVLIESRLRVYGLPGLMVRKKTEEEADES